LELRPSYCVIVEKLVDHSWLPRSITINSGHSCRYGLQCDTLWSSL